MSSIEDMMTTAFMAGVNYCRMMITQMPQLTRQDAFTSMSCVSGSPCEGVKERQPQEDEGEYITDEEVTELRFTLHELYDARFVEALDDEDVRNLVTQYVKDEGGANTDRLVRTLESKHRITIKGTTMDSENTNTIPSTVADAFRTESWEGVWGDAITDETKTQVKPTLDPKPSSNGKEQSVELLDMIFEKSVSAAPAPMPLPESTPVALDDEWTEVAAPSPELKHPIFGRNVYEWCREQTGSNFLALNTRFKNWWAVRRPARLMYCGAKRPMIPYNHSFGEFKYYIDNLPIGELSLHDIREMIAATGIPVLDVFRPVYPDPVTGRMVAGINIKVTVAAQYNRVSAQEALAILQVAPINFNGTAIRIQRFKGY